MRVVCLLDSIRIGRNCEVLDRCSFTLIIIKRSSFFTTFPRVTSYFHNAFLVGGGDRIAYKMGLTPERGETV